MTSRATTARGRLTRQRIVNAARELFSTKGVGHTSVGDILSASGTGKSQFYHYFENKNELVRLVLRQLRLESLPDPGLGFTRLDSCDRIERWFDDIIRQTEASIAKGGRDAAESIGGELAKDGLLAREVIRTLSIRRRLLQRGLRTMASAGLLSPAADSDRLASFAAAAIEGGIRLAYVDGTTAVLQEALAETMTALRRYARSEPLSESA